MVIEAKARVIEMLEPGLSSPVVPYGADQTLVVVVDRIGASREVRIERTDTDTTIRELIAGCFSDPVRVIEFNTLEHWVRDISAETATELQARCDIDGVELPDHLRDFVESHIGAARCVAAPVRAAKLQPVSPNSIAAG
jgi:hypothetical protein